MSHLPLMIYDLAVILAAAGGSTLLFKKLKQPIVLGYLIAGFAVGPNFSPFPTVVDTEGVKLWAEIGVIFLLFGLGLEFSFKKLVKVGKSASISAVFEIVTMTVLGYLLGRALGWKTMDCIYLGAILSMSSTTIIIRAFDEAGLKGKTFVSLVFGILIVEDLMAILIMVVLTAISVPDSFSGSNLLFLAGRLGFFLLIWFLVGIYLLPSVLKKLRSLLSDEIMLIVSLGLCLGMVVLATQAEFSAALGAFVMGAILAETEEGERIEHLLLPVKNLFAAVFFVSVGMLINPAVLNQHLGVVILITVITVIGKLFGSGIGAVLSGRSLKHSVQAGMSLAQIGEFSFIIATLGMSLKVTSDFLYPIVIAVSAVTTFTTPYMIKYSGPIYTWIEARLPSRMLEGLRRYEIAMNTETTESAVTLIARVYGLAALLNSVVVIAITVVSSQILLPFLIETFGDSLTLKICACITTLLLASPFLFAILLRTPKNLSTKQMAVLTRLRNLQFGLFVVRFFIGIGLIGFIIKQYSSTEILLPVVLVTVLIVLFLFRASIKPLYLAVERRFLQNLNAKELAELEKTAQIPELAPWNATLFEITLSSDSKVAGKSLEEIKFRSMSGATVAMIDRGKKRIFAPSRSERLLPNDKLFLIGTEEQLLAARNLTDIQASESSLAHEEMFSLESVAISEQSAYIGKSIREIGMGDAFSALIVGIERDGNRILNPESTVVLEARDLIWVFGHGDRIAELRTAAGKA